MEALTAHLGHPQPDTPNITPKRDADNSPTNYPKASEAEAGVRSLSQLSATKTCIRRAGTSKVINFWFGRLLLTTSALESRKCRGNGATLQKVGFMETNATLIPSKWLLLKGVILKITQLVAAVVAPSIQFSQTPVMIISEDHEIVFAMRFGDLTKVQQLILGGRVHPASIFPDGSSLVQRCVDEVEEQILPAEDLWYKFEEDSDIEAQDLSFEAIRIIFRLIEIATWLVSYGSAPDAPNMYGE